MILLRDSSVKVMEMGHYKVRSPIVACLNGQFDCGSQLIALVNNLVIAGTEIIGIGLCKKVSAKTSITACEIVALSACVR